MSLFGGLTIVIIAGILQGSYFLPMTYTKRWEWAHSWFAFSLLGMLLINWIIAFLSIGEIGAIISSIPSNLMLQVLLFGLLWGAGAILFGKAMDMLGMALGYPIIMGINAVAGAIVPALVFSADIFLHLKGVLIIVGSIISVVGIVFCASASSQKEDKSRMSRYTSMGLILAVISGFTSCLPNLGAAFSKGITDIAIEHGVNKAIAGNVIWSLFFTTGAVVNMGYCLFVLERKRETAEFFNSYKTRNWGLLSIMSLMWIGSFYAYGYGSVVLGDLGLIVGWPLLVSLSIVVGNLWGIFRGEWRGAPIKARNTLNLGMLVLIVSVVVIALSNLF
ncbi:MAG: L-rhamnose/proton symporter RhaT [Bacteroidales bacterium]